MICCKLSWWLRTKKLQEKISEVFPCKILAILPILKAAPKGVNLGDKLYFKSKNKFPRCIYFWDITL